MLVGIKNFKGKPFQRTWFGTSSGNAVKGNMELVCFIIFLLVGAHLGMKNERKKFAIKEKKHQL